jgi:diaminohydroxyphosphoribosylaminopyrimidine deaminase / 5-amino-6-(5-phosphoribosylamino)uracil reductase
MQLRVISCGPGALPRICGHLSTGTVYICRFPFMTVNSSENYMQRCIALARLAKGHTAPNPLVGSVLVFADRIIGEGYHQQYGGPHAEVNCIRSVKEEDRKLISASVLYVSLEPCAHFGKTPPCADLIIEMQIPKVIIGCRDPFYAVDGKGIEKLTAAGVEVEVGVLENECVKLNRRFFTFHTRKRPHIILKWAQSGDGKIGTGNNSRIFISNEFTNRKVHQWRSEEAAILIGTRTASLDNPKLNAHLSNGPDPIKLVIDRHLLLPLSLHLFVGGSTIIFNTVKQAEHDDVLYHRLADETNLLPQILDALYGLNVLSVLVEGGRQLLQSFIDAGLWDEARVIDNEALIIKEGVDAPLLRDQRLVHTETLYTDRIRYYEKT